MAATLGNSRCRGFEARPCQYQAENALRNQPDTGINTLLAFFDSGIRMTLDIETARIPESRYRRTT
jgi:hypothetical protein